MILCSGMCNAIRATYNVRQIVDLYRRKILYLASRNHYQTQKEFYTYDGYMQS